MQFGLIEEAVRRITCRAGNMAISFGMQRRTMICHCQITRSNGLNARAGNRPSILHPPAKSFDGSPTSLCHRRLSRDNNERHIIKNYPKSDPFVNCGNRAFWRGIAKFDERAQSLSEQFDGSSIVAPRDADSADLRRRAAIVSQAVKTSERSADRGYNGGRNLRAQANHRSRYAGPATGRDSDRGFAR